MKKLELPVLLVKFILSKKGWTKPRNDNERPIRDRQSGMKGQYIWRRMYEAGWVGGKGSFYPKYIAGTDPTNKLQERIKNWLIWGYWETNEQAPYKKRIKQFLEAYNEKA